MRRLAVLLALATLSPAAPADAPVVIVLSYHDIRDDTAAVRQRERGTDVSMSNLVAHLSWLKANDFHVLSLDEVLAATRGERSLPDRAVMLSFDDGLRSMYTHVFPLLVSFGYPAIVSPVTAWLEPGADVEYERERLGTEDFVSWEQLREMQASGLVEIASHTHDLHQGIVGNPQGNLQPAAITRAWSPEGYESEPAYLARVRADLAASAAAIEQHTGRRPRIVTWPYGAHNAPARALARELGMSVSLTLDTPGPLQADDLRIGRDMLVDDPGIAFFASSLLEPRRPRTIRAVRIQLDEVYAPDPAEQERHLDVLLEDVRALGVSHAVMSAVTDTDADGQTDAAYFPSRHLPMQADLFNRVAWQLATRIGVRVFASLPLGDELSPQALVETYADLAAHASFDGLVFEDGPEGAAAVPEAELLAAVRRYRPGVPAALSVPAAGLEPGQLSRLVRTHDFVILVAEPDATARGGALRPLVAQLASLPGGLDRVIFEVNPGAGARGASDLLPGALNWLTRQGARHLVFSPTGPLSDRPSLAALRSALSLADVAAGE